nr:hypothetical protein [Tanacetum cinerariifolium]
MEAGGKDRPPMLAPDKQVLISKGSPDTTTEMYMETYKTVSQDIHNQLNVDTEAVQIILTGIDNDINSTFDACSNACEMWKAIKRLKQGESINVQDLETNLYWEFGKFTSQDGESLESYYSSTRMKLMKSELKGYHNSSTRSQQAATRNRGKEIVNSPQPIYDQEPSMVAEDDKTLKDKEIEPKQVDDDEASSKEKEIDKIMTLILMYFKKIYTPTKNNLITSSKTKNMKVDNTLRSDRRTRYDRQTGQYGNQRAVNVVEARENL